MAAEKQRRPGRARQRERDLPGGLEKGVWHPELVGQRNYPKTLEAYERKREINRLAMIEKNKSGKMFRKGVPDGWGGRKLEAIAARENAKVEAKKVIQHMLDARILAMPTNTDEEKALVGLEAVTAMVLDPTMGERERLAAAKTLLEYTKSKPAAKSEIKVEKAEDLLAILAREENAA